MRVNKVSQATKNGFLCIERHLTKAVVIIFEVSDLADLAS